MSLPNIDFMMDMIKEFLSHKIDDIAYTLDFPYELEQRYKKMHREDDDYWELIYECLYKEDIALYNEFSDADFKKLIRKQYNYIKKLQKKDFIRKPASHFDVKLAFLGTVCVPPLM